MNGVTHEYVVDGTKIISDCWSESTVRHYIAYIYDAKGVIGMAYRNSSMSAGVFEYYIFEKNLQGDIVAVYDEYGFAAVTYTYDAWGNVTETLYDTTSNGQYNSFRYRGYFYDEDTELYYLNSRYYDPATGRFLNADVFINANGDLTGFNMYAYCSNNPVMYVDASGKSIIGIIALLIGTTLLLTGCSSPSKPKEELANAPDLNVDSATPDKYNCYGNAIGKQIAANPTGYKRGDSTRETFNAVKKDLGENNVRELDSINDPISDDEFKVALKCGPSDYHFIRLDGDKWYNKSGLHPGLYIDQAIVERDIWFAMWMNNGKPYMSFPFYDDETIYFAVKVGWDEK